MHIITHHDYIKLKHKHTSGFQNISVYNILRTLSGRIDVHVSLCKNPCTLTRNTSGQRHIQLSVWKNRLREVDTYIRYGLTLRLLIVIAKLNRMGNCFFLNLNGRVRSSEGDIGILGMNTLLPACCPLTISASIVLFWNPRTTAECHCRGRYEDQDYEAI